MKTLIFAVLSVLFTSSVALQVAEVDSSEVAHPRRVQIALQLSLATRRFRSGSGTKLHHRQQKMGVSGSSKRCMALPADQRAACERKVDKLLLTHVKWDVMNPKAEKKAFSVKLDHD
eukprot:TRINITY_DN63253_c0_g1_i1.p1 TRINITY_DN63253_c0_g1~~TRINITY_DN63253_c0_g1_i1.p1  ORF type:complete len:117 (+),score=23.25 TRINITY_DN63253_c0_g1_i1:164-514(+)